MDPNDLHKGFWRGEDYSAAEGIYHIHYATVVDHDEDIVSYVSGLSICTFEAAVRDRQEYRRCTVQEFAAMVQHELKEPEIKWKKA